MAAALVTGVVLFGGFLAVTRDASEPAACPPPADHPEWTVARRWNEALLNAIRRDVPAPTVHARNLFHTSAAMWDAWAAYDDTAVGYVVTEKHDASDVAAAREEAMSYAAFRVLESRYLPSIGAEATITEILGVMDSLCYSPDVTTMTGDSPAAVGIRIAERYLEVGLSDGSNESDGYIDPDYAPVNSPLTVTESGTILSDPNRWQPLQLEQMISQNGIPIENGVQEFIDSHWGYVERVRPARRQCRRPAG